MSNTPRTDAVADYWLEPGMSAEHEIVPAQIARELERELATERVLADRLAKACESARLYIIGESLPTRSRAGRIVACALAAHKAARNEAHH